MRISFPSPSSSVSPPPMATEHDWSVASARRVESVLPDEPIGETEFRAALESWGAPLHSRVFVRAVREEGLRWHVSSLRVDEEGFGTLVHSVGRSAVPELPRMGAVSEIVLLADAEDTAWLRGSVRGTARVVQRSRADLSRWALFMHGARLAWDALVEEWFGRADAGLSGQSDASRRAESDSRARAELLALVASGGGRVTLH